jgi:hypothetical protein
VKDVADACRSAALGFAWGANRGWGRRELARWLAGPYAHAVAATRYLRAPRLARPPYRPIAASTIDALLATSHARVIEGLRAAWTWKSDASFARDFIDAGLVVGVSDDPGGIGYAPADLPDMRLVDRVRSLFIADYLTRPDDYASFGVCDDCDGVSFDVAALHDGCWTAYRTPESTSRVVLRRAARRTLVGVGEVRLSDRRVPVPRLSLLWEEEEESAASVVEPDLERAAAGA